MLFAGGVLSLGRVSFAVAYEGREWRHRVPAEDHRQTTTETAALRPEPGPAPEAGTAPEAAEPPPPTSRTKR